MVSLTATCSAVIQKSLPAKMKDLGSFTGPCTIGKYEFKKALGDLGESINLIPLLVVQRLSLGELTPIEITLQMVDRSMAKPEGVLEDVLVKVDHFLCGFYCHENGRGHTGSSVVRKTFLSNWSCSDRCTER